MDFNLQAHANIWLTMIREQRNNAQNPQLRNLLQIEVVALEKLTKGLDVDRYMLIDTQPPENARKFREMYEQVAKMNPPPKTQFKGPERRTLGKNVGVDGTFMAKVTYSNGELKREVLNPDDVFKSPEQLIRDAVAKATKLSEVKVRLVMAEMKDAPLRDVVYECLKRYGESIAGKGSSVQDAASYYAEYHIAATMKVLNV